ncbi:MAG: M20 family peptidase [Bacillota bacterium]|jgi:carboxypeptidase PM20D1|nr:M20 family peptidase [Bacillota bacterium]
MRDFNLDNAIKHLSDAVKIETVSNIDYEKVEWYKFDDFLAFLEKEYPNVHKVCKREIVNKYAPVYKWEGKNNNYKPVLFLGHYDVVPADKSSETLWKEDPFSGIIKDGCIWGRGTLDDKNQVIAIMEAAEHLISNGFIPERDIYFAFGFDEEVGGQKGAKKISELFQERKLQFDFVIDEGGCVIKDVIDGLTCPLAVIGIAEKGSTNIKITAKGRSGHSSMPPKDTSSAMLAKIISNTENNQMPAKLTLPVQVLFEKIAPYMGGKKIILKNIKTLFPLVNSIIAKSPTLNALIRTTITFTKLSGGQALNVIPQEVSAYANMRILPGDTVDDAVEHIKNVNKGIDFNIELLNREEASPVSPIDSEGYRIITNIIYSIFPETIPVPYLMAGGTDSRKYYNVCNNIYRFSPVIMSNEDKDSIHSVNEKITVENFRNMIRFFIDLIEACNSK